MTRPAPATRDQAEQFFAASPLGAAVFRRVQAVIDDLGPCDLRVARTQVGWGRRRGFAFLWLPGRWLTHAAAEVVLTISADRLLTSPRWKQVTEIRPDLITHHLELHDVGDVDDEVAQWLACAYDAAR